jgi:hypothetical protein
VSRRQKTRLLGAILHSVGRSKGERKRETIPACQEACRSPRIQDCNGVHHWILGLMFPHCVSEEGKGCFALDEMCELINLLVKH